MSHYFDELPPVTALMFLACLEKIERLSADISTVKQAMSMQTSTCEHLRVVTADINKHVSVIEQPRLGGGSPHRAARGPQLGIWRVRGTWCLGTGARGLVCGAAPVAWVGEEVPSLAVESVAQVLGAPILDASQHCGGSLERGAEYVTVKGGP